MDKSTPIIPNIVKIGIHPKRKRFGERHHKQTALQIIILQQLWRLQITTTTLKVNETKKKPKIYSTTL